MDRKNFNVEKIIYIVIVLVMILIPLLKLSTYIPSIERIYIEYFELKRVYILWLAIFFLLTIYIYLILSKKEQIGISDIIIYILTVVAFISTKDALNFEKSFFGEIYRNEGLLTIIS